MTTVLLAAVGLSAAFWLAMVLLRRPQTGVLVLAALAPFDGLLLIIPHPPVVEQWKQALVLATLAATFVAPASARSGRSLPEWVLPAALLGLLGLASAIVVGGVQGVEGFRISFFYLLVPLILMRCPFDARDRDRLVSVLMVTGLLTALVGLGQQVVGGAALNALGYEWNTQIRSAGGLLRSFSTFNQPFPFGLWVMTVLLVALPVALAAPRRPRNAVFLVASPVLVLGMLSSTVRAAILGLAVGLVFLAIHRYRGFAHLLVPLVAGVALVPPAVVSTFLSSDSLGDRTTGWADVIDIIVSSPFGVGIGATGSAAEKTSMVGADTSKTLVIGSWTDGYQPDNYFVKTILELGPLGLWLLVLVIVAVFAASRAASKQLGTKGDSRDAALAAGIAASTLAAAAASFVAMYFEIFPVDMLFWLLAGVLVSLPVRRGGGRFRGLLSGPDARWPGTRRGGRHRREEQPAGPAVAAGAHDDVHSTVGSGTP